MRAASLALAAALAVACEPGFPLPTVQGPSATWQPPAPPADGPCLQATRVHKHSYLWKRGIAQPGAYEHALADATADDPAAHALVVRGIHEDRSAIATGVFSMATWWSGVIALGTQSRLDDRLAVGLTFGAASVGGLATTIALAVRSSIDESRAVTSYNAECLR